MVQVFLGDHDVPHKVCIPAGLLGLLHIRLGEDVVEVLAGGFPQPAVADFGEAVVIEVPWPLAS